MKRLLIVLLIVGLLIISGCAEQTITDAECETYCLEKDMSYGYIQCYSSPAACYCACTINQRLI